MYQKRRREKKLSFLSLSLSLASCIDNKNEEGENEKAFYNIFLSSFFHAVTIAHIYLLICTLLSFLSDGYIRGFFVQVYDRLAYVKYTRISWHNSDQLQIHAYVFYDMTERPCIIEICESTCTHSSLLLSFMSLCLGQYYNLIGYKS
jgi:hypothetical protein